MSTPATESAGSSPASNAFYVTGGTLAAEAPSYVPRRADHDLRDALDQGEFCYVLNTRQMGKSSLMIRAAHHLRRDGVTVAVLDLTAVGQNLTPEQWYDGLLMSLAEQVHREDDLEDFWADNANLGPMQRFLSALRQVVLPDVPKRLVVFVDEIDAVRSLPFPADEFFAGIRECYNHRRIDPVYDKLTFCLLGVATPADLIRDTRLSPFNIGRRVLITDFTPAEAAPLARGLGDNGPALLARALAWTGGHPYMTQRLCRELADGGVSDVRGVDAACEKLFLTKQARETDDNLAFVRNRLLRSEADLAGLLDLYQQVRTGRRIPDDETNPLVPVLRLSGVVAVADGRLQLRNKIYDRVFDRAWVQAHMPNAEVRRQREAYRRGALRTAALASVVFVLMGLLSAEALHQKATAQASARTAQQALSAERSAERQARAALKGARQANGVAQQRTRDAENQKTAALAANGRAGKAAAQERRQAQAAVRQKQIAEKARQDAQAAQVDAEKATRTEKAAKQDAEIANRKTRNLLHVADLQLAGQTWNSETGSPVAVRALLSSSRAAPAEDGERFEWRYQWALLHGGVAAPLPGGDGQAAVTDDGSLVALDGSGSLRRVRTADAHSPARSLPAPGWPPPSSSALAPDGQRVAFAWADGRVRVLDTATRRRLTSWAAAGPVTGLRFSQDGRTVFGFVGSRTALAWAAADGRETGRWPRVAPGPAPDPEAAPRGWRVPDPTGTWSDDGRFQATVAGGQVAVVDVARLREASYRPPVFRVPFPGKILAAAFSPDGRTLALGDDQGWVSRQDPATGAPKADGWAANTADVAVLAYSRDGARLATGAGDGQIRLWDMGGAAPRLQAALKGHLSGITRLAFAGGGRWLSSVSTDGTARAWDLTALAPPPLVTQPGRIVESLAFAPDGRTLAASAYDGPAFWNTRTRRAVAPFYGGDGANRLAGVQCVALSPDGQSVAMDGYRVQTKPTRLSLQVWDRATGRPRWRWQAQWPPGRRPLDNGIDCLAFSPDGRLLAGGFGWSAVDGPDHPQAVLVWDAATGRVRRILTGFANSVSALSFSPDGGRLAVGCHDRTLRCFDTKTWTEVRRLRGALPLTSVAFAPDGRTLAVGDRRGGIQLWDTANWRRIRALTGHGNGVYGLAFSPDGRTLASASWDSTVKLWDVGSGRETRTLTGDGHGMNRLAFSPDGQGLAAGDRNGSVWLWRAASDARVTAWARQESVPLSGTPTPLLTTVTTREDRTAAAQVRAAARAADERARAERELMADVRQRRVPGYARPDTIANLLRRRNGGTRWAFWYAADRGARATQQVSVDDDVTFHVSRVAQFPWQVQLTQNQLPLRTGARYVLQFRARADRERTITVQTQRDVKPLEPDGLLAPVTLSPEWRPFRLSFAMRDVPPGNGMLAFLLGDATGDVQIADAVLVPEQAPPGEGGSRIALTARRTPLGAPRWTNLAAERAQSDALLQNIAARRVPGDDRPAEGGGLLRIPNGQPAFGLWQHPDAPPNAATVDGAPDGVLTAHVRRADDQDWHVALRRGGLPLVNGGRYVLQFRARADAPQTIRVSSQDDAAPHDKTGLQESVTLSPVWRAFRLPFQIGLDGPPGQGEIIFDIGQRANTLQIADLVLVPAPAPEGRLP